MDHNISDQLFNMTNSYTTKLLEQSHVCNFTYFNFYKILFTNIQTKIYNLIYNICWKFHKTMISYIFSYILNDANVKYMILILHSILK